MLKINNLNLEEIKRKDIETIRIERNKYSIRSKMLNQKLISKVQQIEWFKNIDKQKKNKYFKINYKSRMIGVGSIKNIDRKNSISTWGFFIFEKFNGVFGLLAEIKILDEIFLKEKIYKIYGHTISTNKEILKIHKICGFRIEGTLKKHLIVRKKRLDIILTSLFKKDWLKNRIHLQKKFKII